MKYAELKAYENKNYLSECNHSLSRKIRPFFSDLIAHLISLPEKSSIEQRLNLFENCIRNINKYENDIETVEREEILGAIYEIGTIVNLDSESRFAEQWRGDW